MTTASVHFVPTPDRVIAEMLRLAEVCPGDVVYDLGCGDGRILIAAARERGARGVGLDIEPELVAAARENARVAGVQDLVRFETGNFFGTDLTSASVIALYLLDSLNLRLRPRILSQCAPGTRIVSYSFEMGEWECDAHTPIAANGVSLWIVPVDARGTWMIRPDATRRGNQRLLLEQRYQRVFGTLETDAQQCGTVSGMIRGEEVAVNLVTSDFQIVTYSGKINGDSLELASVDGESLEADRLAGSLRETN